MGPRFQEETQNQTQTRDKNTLAVRTMQLLKKQLKLLNCLKNLRLQNPKSFLRSLMPIKKETQSKKIKF
jgi:hypothetical protein